MRTPYDLENDKGLKTFYGIVCDVLNSNLSSFVKQPAEIALSEVSRMQAVDLTADYPDGVLVKATEAGNGYEVGLIFKIADITALADMMLMGDGESKTELDNDLTDAITEIANQFFGGLTVPLETQLGRKLSFRVDGVSKNDDSFSAANYLAATFMGNLNGEMIFRLYADEGFSSLLSQDAPQAASIGTDFFADAPMKEEHRHTGASNNPNMEMLLDIEIPVSVRMGSAKLFLKDILGLGPGNIVELDQNASDSIELTVNDHLIALGEVVIVDGYFGFRIKEIISKAERIKRLKD
ncbi:MAG: FliM/FliN family flagellar motor switch protein [Deferribacteraceae bacterium]|jgi:flagellar motor switch protein FliN/FliY|nr:FliM/FliN family flagellar motor switch protein [Deferribacteraceae bacterium]